MVLRTDINAFIFFRGVPVPAGIEYLSIGDRPCHDFCSLNDLYDKRNSIRD